MSAAIHLNETSGFFHFTLLISLESYGIYPYNLGNCPYDLPPVYLQSKTRKIVNNIIYVLYMRNRRELLPSSRICILLLLMERKGLAR